MFKGLILLLTFISLTAWGQPHECDPSEKSVMQKFLPSPFGKLAWNILESEAEEIINLVADYKSKNPKIELVHLDILVCTSAYPLAPISITDKNQHANVDQALQRALKIKKRFNQQTIPTEVAHKVCGPAFVPLDKNWRIVVKGKSGDLYDRAYKDIEKTEGILELYKTEALIETFAEVKAQYPEPFLAKYKPFQGYRVKLFGKELCGSNNHKIKAGQEKAKGAKQE